MIICYILYNMIKLCIFEPMNLPEGGIFVEVADNIFALLDLSEKVFLTWDFSVLSMAFRQQLLKKTERTDKWQSNEYHNSGKKIANTSLSILGPSHTS